VAGACHIPCMPTPRSARAFTLALCLTAITLAGEARADCPASPRPLCRDMGQTKVSFEADSGRFAWKATRGPITTRGDLGDPRASTSYSLCAWDDSGILLAARVPAAALCGSSSCWSERGSAGLRFEDSGGLNGNLRSLSLFGSDRARTSIRAAGFVNGGIALPATGRLVVQLQREDSPICFESALEAAEASTNDASGFSAKARFDATVAVPPLGASGCGTPSALYVPGVSTTDAVVHDGLERTFRVYLPSSYDSSIPAPVVLLFHGGFGTAAQVEASSRLLEVAEVEGFVVISGDGVAGPGNVRTWNAGRCCGYAEEQDIDDVGFVAALLDHVEADLCVDLRRVYAAGMSNGGLLSHRLACDLADRVRAVAPVSGTDMTSPCHPARPVPVFESHGSLDANIPFEGGLGCGAATVAFTSVPSTIERWRGRDACSASVTASVRDGEAACTTYGKCAAGVEVELCVVEGGGHQWPGGLPPATSGFPGCPFGYQRADFSASRSMWEFFSTHPMR
jgi:polyhydroxybutyrate depolymerase